jgi:hypothetical protein
MDKAQRLRQLARGALVRARGDVALAMVRLDADIIKADDIELERELTAFWREYALRRVLNTNLTDLQSEGVIPRPQEERASDDATSRRETWAHTRVREMEQRTRRNYLNDFKVNGEPIGDLTPETVLVKADLYERDARFMRLIASGVPPQSRIRDFITPEEAEQRWKMAQEAPPQTERDARQTSVMKLLTRSRGLNDEEYRDAQARVRELEALPEPSRWDSVELDALARVMSEYETKHER